jgi:integrase
MPVQRLTSRNVGSLRPVEGTRTDYFDPSVPGFHLRVSPTGARSYAVFYRTKAGEQRRYTIGAVGPHLTLAAARKEARGVLADVVKGKDPQHDRVESREEARRKRDAPTFGAIADKFLKESASRLKPNTLKTWRWILAAEVVPAIGSKRPEDVTKADVRALVARIAADRPTYANRVFELVRRVYTWALEREDVAATPCAGLRKPSPERQRDRVLTDDEVRKVWTAADGDGLLGEAVKLLLLTGARREEVLGATWTELDLDAGLWRLPAARSKAGERRNVPLSSGAREVLDRLKAAGNGSAWLFPSPVTDGPVRLVAKAAARIRQRSGVDNWTWHDLRRTTRTRLAELGVAPHVAQAILGHTRSGIDAVYNRFEPVPEMRSALEAWSRRLAAIVSGERTVAEVVPFAAR